MLSEAGCRNDFNTATKLNRLLVKFSVLSTSLTKNLNDKPKKKLVCHSRTETEKLPTRADVYVTCFQMSSKEKSLLIGVYLEECDYFDTAYRKKNANLQFVFSMSDKMLFVKPKSVIRMAIFRSCFRNSLIASFL